MRHPGPGPDPESLRRLAATLTPGGTIRRVADLLGGLDAAMSAFDLESPDGSVQHLVLRLYASDSLARHPKVPVRAWRTLHALERIGFPAPLPVWLDEEGKLFGAPAMVMTRIPGRSILSPRDLPRWTRELASALARLHRVPAARDDFAFLPGPGDTAENLLAGSDWLADRIDGHPDGGAVVDLLRRWLPNLQRTAPVLVHGDYWAGNTVWGRARIRAIVDWDSAARDQPGLDVGYCRMDLGMLAGANVSELFLHEYEQAAGRPVQQLPFWDLLAALRALPDPARWLPGYKGLGRSNVTATDMRTRLQTFINGALERAALDEP